MFHHVFNHSGLPMQLIIVAGGDDELYQRLQAEEWHGVTRLYNYVENMPVMMRASDCVISKAGGLIITEALACGLPMLLIDATPGQELGNADFVVKNGVGELATEPLTSLETLFHWLHKDGALLKKYQARAQALGRPQSAYTAGDLIWSAAERGPIPSPDNHTPVLPKLLELLHSFDLDKDDEESPGRGDRLAIV